MPSDTGECTEVVVMNKVISALMVFFSDADSGHEN